MALQKSGPRTVFIIKDSYLKMIENSLGTRLFQNFYIYNGKNKKDGVKDGELSCAFFVSFILNNFDLINKSHLTVKSTIGDMQESGWIKIKKPRKGAVIVWKKKLYPDGKTHSHIGFYVGNRQAISNSQSRRTPVRHYFTFGSPGSKLYRQMTTIFWHKKLDS